MQVVNQSGVTQQGHLTNKNPAKGAFVLKAFGVLLLFLLLFVHAPAFIGGVLFGGLFAGFTSSYYNVRQAKRAAKGGG